MLERVSFRMKKKNVPKKIKYRIYHNNGNQFITENAEMADTYYKRLIGLLGRSHLSVSEALILKPCNAIHTFWMKFSIDVIFLDSEQKICHLIENMKKNRISKLSFHTKCVIELPAGQIKDFNLKVGDQLEIIKDPF